MLRYIVRTFVKPFYDGLYGRDSDSTPITNKKDFSAQTTSKTTQSSKTETISQSKNIAEQKGEQFEKYIVNLFDKTFFKVIEWRGDKYSNGHFPESNKYPDLEMMLKAKDGNFFFAVECKYRSILSNHAPIDHVQLRNYENFQKMKGIPVFIALGVGGAPSNPESTYIIPLDYYINNKWNPTTIERFLKKGEMFYFDKNTSILK